MTGTCKHKIRGCAQGNGIARDDCEIITAMCEANRKGELAVGMFVSLRRQNELATQLAEFRVAETAAPEIRYSRW